MAKKPKTKKSGTTLPRIEFIIVAVFLICVIWLISKCNRNVNRIKAEGEELNAALVQPDTPAVNTLPPSALMKDSVSSLTKSLLQTKTPDYSRLYVTIDGLNLRRDPNLESEVVVKLPLFEEVFFLNEVTDTTTELSLGYEIANEPWVKVKTKKGHEGWVYGAGVNYYKKKREGTLE